MTADADVAEAKMPHVKVIDNSLLSLGRLEKEQAIKDFFAKPIPVQNGTLATTDTVSTFSDIALNNLFTNAIWANKLYGFLGVRCDFVFTLQVNATRFQQARYMLYFNPTCGSSAATNAYNKRAIHNFSLMSRTQCPHAEIDVATQSRTTLKVPFISAMSYHPLGASNDFHLGMVSLAPYVAMSSGTASFTIWCHLENVELFTATVPQSGRMRRGKNNIEAEQDSQQIGPIAGTLKKVSKAAEIAGRVPLLSAFAEPVSWVSNILGDVASVFGWSKPVNLDHTTRFTKGRGYFLQNYNGPDNSAVLALSSENQLMMTPGFASTDIDEMSFDYIKSIPSYFTAVNWTTADAKETLLKSIALEPATFYNTYTDSGQTCYVYAPCSFPNIFFGKWRGSFNITIKMVKTEFHSGRLMVAFEPYMGEGVAAPTSNYSTTNYLHREIIDVRNQNEWTFNFPYSHPFIYKSNVAGRPYGYVRIYVVDALVAPATVSSTVTMLFEVSGAEDLEYAFPRATTYCPYVPSAPQSGEPFSAVKPPAVERVIGTADVSNSSIAPSASVIGEKFLSFRQLLKRIQFRPRTSAKAGNTHYNLIPFAWTPAYVNGVTLYPPILAPDMYTWCCSMYALARGGLRFRMFSAENTSVTANVTYLLDAALYGSSAYPEFSTSTTDWYTRSGPVWLAGGPAGILDSTENVTCDVQVPMYSSSYAFPVCDAMCTQTLGVGPVYQITESLTPQVLMSTQLLTGLTNAPCPMRGGADDMSFGCFISTPPVVDIAANLVNNWT